MRLRAATVKKRGSALLAVLWLSAALSAIAFSLAITVRGETERTSTAVDGLRAYYLATGAVHRASLELLWSMRDPNAPNLIPKGAPFVDYHFASGDAHVEIIPETAKLDVNRITLEELSRLVMALGAEPGLAGEIANAIVDWRHPATEPSGFDVHYLSLTPSFQARHASFEEIEELLLVRGVTPDLFYGTYLPVAEGTNPGAGPRLLPRPGLAECLSVYGSNGQLDVNTVNSAVLAAVGVDPYAISAIVERRRTAPLTQQQLGEFLQSIGAGGNRLRVGGNSIFTLRATARLHLENGQPTDLRRTVAAQVKYVAPWQAPPPIHILRWYDMAWSN